VTIDTGGKVSAVRVVRSVPPFDDAAIAAVRKWEYEPVTVAGRPTAVRLTVPVTFSLRLPDVERQPGIPELRAGAAPLYPSGIKGKGEAVVSITITPSGDVLEVKPVSGERSLTDALQKAAQSWRFAAIDGEETATFRLEAEFVPGSSGGTSRVSLRLAGLQRELPLTGSSRIAQAAQAQAEASASSSSPEATPSAGTQAPAGVPSNAPKSPPEARAESSTPVSGDSDITSVGGTPPTSPAAAPIAGLEPGAPRPPSPPGAGGSGGEDLPAAQATPVTTMSQSSVTAKTPSQATPPVETVAAPPPPTRILEAGASAIRDVRFDGQIPDLMKGRRPAVPPLARIGGVSADVVVSFSVDAAGVTLLRSFEGPEVLKKATQELIASWVFRRLSPERIFLSATISYKGDVASAVVRPQRQ
jgi:TonB family protein